MLNKVQLIGRVGKDPEVTQLDSGVTVANFSLATTEKYKRDGETREVTEWHNIVVWRGLAEVVEKYVNKGDLLFLEGKMKTRSWEQDGHKRYITEVYADSMKMLGGKKSDAKVSQQEEVINEIGNDLPF